MPDRPEKPITKPLVALVLAALACGCAWAIFTFSGNSPSWRGGGSGGGDGGVRILSAGLKRDYQNGILTLEIEFENTTGNPLRPEPPFVRLLSADSQPVFPYSIDAASRPDPVAPGEKESVTLRYWLEPKHFSGPLELTVGTGKIPVKSGAVFDVQSVGNQATLTLTSPDWNPAP